MKLPILNKSDTQNLEDNPLYGEETKEKVVFSHISFFVILAVCLIGVSICVWKMVNMWQEDKRASALIVDFPVETFTPAQNEIVSVVSPTDSETTTEETTPGTTQESIPKVQPNTSYDTLAAQVPATAYIRIKDTDISYPIMYSTEQGYYLDHAADGSPNRNGAIYLAPENNPTLTDPINYIFGHNMRSGLMFRHLNDFLDANYLASHPDCYIVTEEATRHYTLFYASSISADTELKYFNDASLGTDSYATYMEELSVLTGKELNADTQLIALITCTTSNRENRTIVYGYLN